MKITGNKNVDTVLILGAIAGGGYLVYSVLAPIIKRLSAPTGGSDVIQPPGCNVFPIKQRLIKQDCDKIYELLNGPNFFLYPDEVNKILSYDNCELQYANLYFKQTYGTSLYALISGEWDAQSAYDAAENYLIQNGLGN
jgi:hypothetical protein